MTPYKFIVTDGHPFLLLIFTAARDVSIYPVLRQGSWNNVNNLTTHSKKVQVVTISIQLSKYTYVTAFMWHALYCICVIHNKVQNETPENCDGVENAYKN